MLNILFVLFLTSYNLASCVEENKHGNVELTTTNARYGPEVVSSLSREPYRNFSVDFIRDFILVRKLIPSNITLEGISLWSIAHMLSVIHEKIWFVHTKGLDKILHLKPEEIHRSFKEIASLLFDDQESHMQSNIYTSRKGMVTTKNIDELKTKVNYINYDEPNTNEAIMQINNLISEETFGKINGLVPLGGWYGSPVHNYTLGVFITTFHFNSEWFYPFTSFGVKRFGNEEFKFLEAVGNFDVYHHKGYTAVQIPFKNNNGKSLILIKLNKSSKKAVENFLYKRFNKFLEKMKRSKKNAQNNRQIKIQLPSFNFSKTNPDFKFILHHLGMSKSICRHKLDAVNTLDSLAQSFYGHLDEDKFEVASATASSLTDVHHFQRTHDLNDIELNEYLYEASIESETEQYDSKPTLLSPEVITEDNTKGRVRHARNIDYTENFGKTNETTSTNGTNASTSTQGSFSEFNSNSSILLPVLTNPEIGENSNAGKITSSKGGTDQDSTVVFDTPFIWYLQDDNLGLGPLLLGIVKSSAKVAKPEKLQPGFESLLELEKFSSYSCPDGLYAKLLFAKTI